MTAPSKIYPYEPRYKFEPPDFPDVPFLPPATKPGVDGYPWWVVPPGFLFPHPAPELPPFQLGPTDFGNRTPNVPTNWLQSYYDQNLAQQGKPRPHDGVDPTTQDETAQPDLPERRLAVIRKWR